MFTDSPGSNKPAANTKANTAASLIAEARKAEGTKLTTHRFVVIPLMMINGDKIPIFQYAKRRRQQASIKEINTWFSNGDGRVPKANGIAIALNDTEFGIDTDGEECESIFLKRILPKFSPDFQKRLLNTMHTKTPRGHHRTYKYVADDFPRGINGKTFFRLSNEHSEIKLMGKNQILFERGPGYKIINEVDNIVTLTKSEVDEFLGALEKFSNEEEALTKVVNKLLPYFVKPHRNDIIFSISGYLHKSKTPLAITIEIARRLIDVTGHNDENPNKIFRTIKATYVKDRDSNKVSGYHRLREVLKQAILSNSTDSKTDVDDLVIEIITSIEALLLKAGLFEISYREHQQAHDELLKEGFDASGDYETEDNNRKTAELAGINDDILMQLAPHVHSVISINPPVLYIADSYQKYIVRAVIRFDSESSEESKNDKGQNQKIITRQQKLNLKDKIILAIPRRVVINNNLLTGIRTYAVQFVSKIDKKPFMIGPGSIDYIINELDGKNKILKKLDAGEALRAIFNKYEEKGLAEITESVTQPGFYYINSKFIIHEVTQEIDKAPDPKRALACTELLDELSTKWQNPDIFPTVIRWFTLAPFDYIFKANNRWLPNFHAHGWSSSGKTSLGRIGLGIWRLHTNALRKDYQLGFGNIDNTARLGSVISRSTYPKVINEVGALRAKYNRPLVETIKQQIESLFVRGKYSDGKYQNIPALCNLFFTSNPRAPDDSGYRSKTTIVHHTRDEVHERNEPEAKIFEKWLESKLDALGVLSDFILWYTIIKPETPEQSILLSDKSHDEMAREIIAEFYKFANKDEPEWLDRFYEQKSILEENIEQAYFEIRAFLMSQINEAYTRHSRTINPDFDTNTEITFQMRLNYCLKNKVISYLHDHIRYDGTKEIREIRVTHDMLTELQKKAEHLEGVTTMEDLAKELPNFRYIVAKVGPKSGRILAGEYHDFVDFLEDETAQMSG